MIGDFSYYLGGRFSYAKNKIIDIKENHRPANEEYLYAKGRPINQPYILEAIGFFKDEQDIVDSPKQMFGNVQPGDIKYKDQNNDGLMIMTVFLLGIHPTLKYIMDLMQVLVSKVSIWLYLFKEQVIVLYLCWITI
mgnify:CR=1 FL=1